MENRTPEVEVAALVAETLAVAAVVAEEAELEAARDRLAQNIASLVDQVHPRAIAHRAAADVRGAANRSTSQRDPLST